MTRPIAGIRLGTQSFPYSLRVTQAAGNGITATAASPVNNLAQATISGWFYLFSYGNGGLGRLFYKGSTSSPSAYFDFYQGANDLINFFAGWTTQGQWKATAHLIGAWHHIAISYDSSSVSNIPSIYVDGSSLTVTAVQAPVGTRSADTTALNVGSAGFSTARYGNAAICNFRIHNRILSAAEVINLYQSGIVPSGVVLEYLMNEGSGTTVNDTSGNGSTGTSVGCVYMRSVPSALRSVANTRPVTTARNSV